MWPALSLRGFNSVFGDRSWCLRPGPRVLADGLQRAASVHQTSVRPGPGVSAQGHRGAASCGQQQHEKRGQDREPRGQHHCRTWGDGHLDLVRLMTLKTNYRSVCFKLELKISRPKTGLNGPVSVLLLFLVVFYESNLTEINILQNMCLYISNTQESCLVSEMIIIKTYCHVYCCYNWL